MVARRWVERILSDAVTVQGVRMAEAGEFTLRAVLAGRMGLAEAEALADLIEARTEAERRRATRLAEGALSARVADWRKRLITLAAEVEAHLDFADEGDVGGTPAIDAAAEALAVEIDTVLAESTDADRLTDGYHIAIVGPPNAGKSTLLNALAGRNAAIVSPEPGTTRDVVSVVTELAGYRVTLHDTAGVRDGAIGIEAEGIARTHAAMGTADLVVEVRSPDTVPLDIAGAGLMVWHKADLVSPANGTLGTSMADPASIAALRACLAIHVTAGLADAEDALVTRARQRDALSAVSSAVRNAATPIPLELKAEELRLACAAMARMTGEIGIEDVPGGRIRPVLHREVKCFT